MLATLHDGVKMSVTSIVSYASLSTFSM